MGKPSALPWPRLAPPALATLFKKSLGAVSHALLACSLLACQAEEKERSCADSAQMDLPVRLADFKGRGTVWPHGVHGGAHPEGHPGFDLNLSADAADIPVFAPLSGEVVATTAEADNPGSSCLILDSACIQVNLCHIRMAEGIKTGVSVKRGQLLGHVAPILGGGAYSLHLGTYVESGDRQVCPGDFLPEDSVRCALGNELGSDAPSGCPTGDAAWMKRSGYPEASLRELTLTCADQSRQTFELPAETRLCNPRLPEALRKAIEACMGPGCVGVW